MRVTCSPRLLEVMQRKKKKHISVEVASSPTSDFDYTEIYLRFVSESMADQLVEKKHYHPVKMETGLLLLPPYRLSLEEDIYLDWEREILFHHITWKGIRL